MQVIQTFFISAISGSISAELNNILNTPETLIVLLANSLPAQSAYMLQLIFVSTFLSHGLELLRVYPLSVAFLRRFIGPNLTEKERQEPWKFLNSLEDPPEFPHSEDFAQIVLFYVVFFVYSTIAPITSIFLMFCFLVCESGYRYHFIHNNHTNSDSGGQLWKGFIHVLTCSILVGQVTLIGLLLLKTCFYAVPAVSPLIAITILFMVFVAPKKLLVAENLPSMTCVELDRDFKVAFERDIYLQPALQHPRLHPEEIAEDPFARLPKLPVYENEVRDDDEDENGVSSGVGERRFQWAFQKRQHSS